LYKTSWQARILCSYWITDFSELHRDLCKSQPGPISPIFKSNLPNMFPMKNSLLKSQHKALATFFSFVIFYESRSMLNSPVLKNLQQIQKLLALNG
jgi:hypothetical protein